MFTVLCWTHRIFIVKCLWDDKNQTYICTHTTPGGRRKHCGLPDKEISRKQMPTTVITSWIYVVMTCHILANCGFCDLSSSRACGWACNTFTDSARWCRARGRQTKTNHNTKASLLLPHRVPIQFSQDSKQRGTWQAENQGQKERLLRLQNETLCLWSALCTVQISYKQIRTERRTPGTHQNQSVLRSHTTCTGWFVCQLDTR